MFFLLVIANISRRKRQCQQNFKITVFFRDKRPVKIRDIKKAAEKVQPFRQPGFINVTDFLYSLHYVLYQF